jgi:hypothetical protein
VARWADRGGVERSAPCRGIVDTLSEVTAGKFATKGGSSTCNATGAVTVDTLLRFIKPPFERGQTLRRTRHGAPTQSTVMKAQLLRSHLPARPAKAYFRAMIRENGKLSALS